MDARSKYSKLVDMASIGKATVGMYPTFEEFKKALDTDRVFGDYGKRIVIMGTDNLHIDYLFVKEQEEHSNQT